MKKKKKCELCSKAAALYCESDKASLCWACDSDVHRANFLAGKHSRTLLCRICQSPTPWSGSGTELGRALPVCPACAAVDGGCVDEEEIDGEEEDDNDESSSDDEDNQVVPLI